MFFSKECFMGKAATAYDNRNTGALFVNDKGDNDKRPDYTGKILIDPKTFKPDSDGNVTIYLAAWNKESDKVGTFLSLKASPPKDE